MKSQWHDLALPAARIGEYAIEHVEAPAGHVFNLSTARTAMIGGQPHLTVSFDEPSRWHRLVGPTGVWMSDLPIEQQQHDTLLKPIRGARTVLVGGLGLGYAVTQLA